MVTTSDFQSGRLVSSPSRDHYSMRLDRGTGLILVRFATYVYLSFPEVWRAELAQAAVHMQCPDY